MQVMGDSFPGLLVSVTLLLAGCGGGKGPVDPAASPPAVSGDPAPEPIGADEAVWRWDLVASGDGTALVSATSGEAAIRLFCPAGRDSILVNVPAFRPIGSEERLTFGSGGNAHALVAETRGDRQRGGVSATGAVPGNLAALLGGEVRATYGAQAAGPYPAPPAELVRNFAAACREGAAAPSPTLAPASAGAPSNVSACLMQGDERLTHPPLRAVGTEPFWGARIEGRCVTYSHPENQQGTRVWTKYAARSGGGGIWTGALNDGPFVLTTRPQPGCSDRMSDHRYPLGVELTVGGEQRRGCAEAG
jgi:uncharacterized membrane protein